MKDQLNLTVAEQYYSQLFMGICSSFHWAMFETPINFVFDPEGKIAKNPVSYIPPVKENEFKDFIRIYPHGLVSASRSISELRYRVLKSGEKLLHSHNNPRLTRIDGLVWYAAHELRHKAQGSVSLFKPGHQETRRGYLGVALDVLTEHHREHISHYQQSGVGKADIEFDAEVIAMYVSNLWQEKTPNQIAAMIQASPDQ